MNDARILVTGASGQLGKLVIDSLLKRVTAGEIIAGVRNPSAAGDFRSRDVEVRELDYTKPATLDAAFAGVSKLLLISSSEMGQRLVHHRNAIDAARRAAVGLIVYTSILHADNTPVALAAEHIATEQLIRESTIPFVILRNGWYSENYTGSIGAALQHGAVLGSAGEGRISAASRGDYADAAVAVLTSSENHFGKTYELAGDNAFSMTELAAEYARQSGKPVAYNNMPQGDYKTALQGFGLPEVVADMLADSDTGISKGAMLNESRQLRTLIGRPTTPLADTVKAALATTA